MTSSKNPIRIGLMSPFSGLVELYGPEIAWAGQVAVDEVNEAGGVLGRPVELVVADDGSLPDTAVPAANRLVNDENCVAIIGNLLSNSRISVASMVADPKKVPYLNFSFYEGSIWSRYFFHFAALPNQQIDKMIPYMADRYGKKIFFAGSNYEWPRGSIDAAKRSLIAHGGEVVGEAYLPFGTDRFDHLLDDLGKSGADVFVPYFAGSDQTNLLTQFTERGLKNKIAVVMGHYDEAMVGNLPPHVREGFYSSNTYFMEVDTPESAEYKKRLGSRPDVTGIWPEGNGVLTNFGEGTYLCVKAFAAAAETAGSIDAEDLIGALETVIVKGPQGSVEMDPVTHHARVNTHLSRCREDGTFEIIRSFGSLPPEIPERYRSLFPGLSSKGELGQTDKKHEANVVDENARGEVVVLHADTDGVILQANQHADAVFGFSGDELIGMSIHLLLPPHLRDQHKLHLQRFVVSEHISLSMGVQGEVYGYRKDGSQFPAQATITKTKRGGAWRLIATVFDISGHVEDEGALARQTRQDPLTGLINRTTAIGRLERALERARDTGGKACVILLDIRAFSAMNQKHGFDVGDKVLLATANALIDAVGAGDTVGRIGGDEFLVVSERVHTKKDVEELAEGLSKAVSEITLQLGKQERIAVDARSICITDGDYTADQALTLLEEGLSSSAATGTA